MKVLHTSDHGYQREREREREREFLMSKNKHLVNKSTHRHARINPSRALQGGHGETLKESLHEYRTVATMTPGSRLTTEAE